MIAAAVPSLAVLKVIEYCMTSQGLGVVQFTIKELNLTRDNDHYHSSTHRYTCFELLCCFESVF